MAEIFQGYGATITVDDLGIVIRRKGMVAFSLHGLKGEKRIPFTSISAVQFKPANLMTSGYIQFSIIGGSESRGGLVAATKDENSVLFKGKKQNAEFERLRTIVEAASARARSPFAPVAATSVADQLATLADLMDRDLITRAEFDAQKLSLLG